MGVKLKQYKSRYQEDYTKLSEEVLFLKNHLEDLHLQIASDKILKKADSDNFVKHVQSIKEEHAIETVDPLQDHIPTKLNLKQHDVEVEDVKKKEKLELVEQPKASFFSGLKKTRDYFLGRLNNIFSSEAGITDSTYDDLEELLITSDIGVKTTLKLITELKSYVKASPDKLDPESIKELLKTKIYEILDFSAANPQILPQKINNQPFVILVIGVNGVGKTTTIGKLASKFAAQGLKVLLGAADTFRAAAVEQIEVWAERANVDLHCGADGAKPATVAYEALEKGLKGNYDVVIIDTAGRLHTKVNLMNELGSVLTVIEKLQPGAPHETILVLDAATGQNAVEQAREFNQKAKLSGLVVTKLDGTPKGGIVVAICDELKVPVRYIGVGEGVEDLRVFSPSEFSDALFAENSEMSFSGGQNKSAMRAVRKRPAELQ
ncbi:MAG: signal recognition particle-docking protein FtsY [Proteobacteria bacterium]|nr:signal recognition particle-docking protein FtsY [Pseudomonadota bacterium]